MENKKGLFQLNLMVEMEVEELLYLCLNKIGVVVIGETKVIPIMEVQGMILTIQTMEEIMEEAEEISHVIQIVKIVK